MGGNLSPVVRAFRERNQPPRQESPARSPAAAAAVANPAPGRIAPSIVTPLLAAAAASGERLARAVRERKRQPREEKTARSPEPAASPSVAHAGPRDAAPSILTPFMKAAAASMERLVRACREQKQRFRGEGAARSPQPAVAQPVEYRDSGGTAPSIVTPLIVTAAATSERLVRAFREQKQRFRQGRARSPQPVSAQPVENIEPGGAAPSIVTPLIEPPAASMEWPARGLREPNQPSREDMTQRVPDLAAAPSVSTIAEPTDRAAPRAAAPVAVEAAPAPTAWPKFPRDIGYADRLRANAALLAKLVLMASTVGMTAAEIWQDRWPDAPVKLGPDELKTIKSEAVLVCIQFVDDIADKYLLPLDKNSLMSELQALVASGLESVHGIDAASFQALLQARSREYGECKALRGKEEAADDQAFLRQAANRIAATVGVGDSAFFNDTVTSLLLKQFARWGVPDLLRR